MLETLSQPSDDPVETSQSSSADLLHCSIYFREDFQAKSTTGHLSAWRSVDHGFGFGEKTQSFAEGLVLVLPELVRDVSLLVSCPGEEVIHLTTNCRRCRILGCRLAAAATFSMPGSQAHKSLACSASEQRVQYFLLLVGDLAKGLRAGDYPTTSDAGDVRDLLGSGDTRPQLVAAAAPRRDFP